MDHGFYKNYVFNVDKYTNVSHHIRVISEGSCETNDADNSALITGINYISIYSQRKQ